MYNEDTLNLNVINEDVKIIDRKNKRNMQQFK